MKKFTAWMLAAAFACSFAMLAGCAQGQDSPLEGTAAVVLDRGTDGEDRYTRFTLDLAEAGLTSSDKGIDVLEALRAQGLYYSGTYTSSFGAYLNEIGIETPAENPSYEGETVQAPILLPEGNNYIALYTSVIEEGNPDPESWGGTIEYDGTNVYYAMLGISSLSIVDGVVYYFTVAAY